MMLNPVFSGGSALNPTWEESVFSWAPSLGETASVREDATDERQLQRLWFEHFLPAHLPLMDGSWIEIIQTGWFNLGAGPDFRDAAVRWADGTVTHGDIELHMDGRDWARHHHGQDAAYNNLILHLVLDHPCEAILHSGRSVPCATLSPVLTEPLSALVQRLSGEAREQTIAVAGRCSAAVGTLDRNALCAMLEAAGQFRLLLKAQRWSRQIERDGPQQTLWEALAEALGYKHNSIPFKIAARLCPLAQLQRMKAIQREAALFGCAGFLPRVEISSWPEPNRTHAHRLWEAWWSVAPDLPPTTVPPAAWCLAQCRPANHPHRRLGALGMLTGKVAALDQAFRDGKWAAARSLMQGVRHPFFSNHATLRAGLAPNVSLLLGEGRVTDILLNIGIPWAMAHGRDARSALADLPTPADNHKLKLASQRILPACALVSGKIRFSALEQQGLIHLLQHFCAQDQSNCQHCPFPERLKRPGGNHPRNLK